MCEKLLFTLFFFTVHMPWYTVHVPWIVHQALVLKKKKKKRSLKCARRTNVDVNVLSKPTSNPEQKLKHDGIKVR